jgi:phospholipase/carboxylesterase
VLPDAPLAVAGEPQVRAWYERGGKESPQAVAEALAALDAFIGEVTARFQPPRALLLGFSQGGAVSLRYGLPRPEFFAGIAVLSGSLKRLEDVRATLPATRTQAIFVAHGRHDSLVPYEWSRELVAFLEEAGYRPTYRSYSIDHEISPKEVADLRAWIGQVLA